MLKAPVILCNVIQHIPGDNEEMNSHTFLIIAALLTSLVGVHCEEKPANQGDVQKTYRIMAVGDSITEQGNRGLLLKKLNDAGYRVQFVGSRGSDPVKHEGYGGKNAEFLATVMDKNFEMTPADIVLLHCGHNHFVEEKPIPGILKATEKLITDFRRTNPKVLVLLAQVIPSGKLPKYSYIPELNEELAKLAKRLNVDLVNQAEGFDWNTDTFEDKVHPNAKGKEKMAERWFAALKPIFDKH